MKPKLEPGLIPTFRLFLVLRLIWLLILMARLQRTPFPYRNVDTTQPLVAIHFLAFVLSLLLLIYLFIRPLQHWLQGYYLPIALAFDTVGVTLVAVLSMIVEHNLDVVSMNTAFWPFLFNLFLVLILTAWQYGMRGIFWLCGGLLLLDILFGIPMIALGYTRLLFVVIVNIARAFSFLLIGYLISRLVSAQRVQRKALHEANRQLVRYASTVEELAISQERNRLARELHDTLAHSLSALAVHLEATYTLIDQNPMDAKARLSQSLEVTRSGLIEARRAIRALRGEPLETLGLSTALRRYAKEQARLANLTLTLDVSDQLDPLDSAVETVIYNIGKEGITNVIRHANADSLHLTFLPQNGHILMEIIDNGTGFNPDLVPHGHYGVKGMQERAAGIGATLSIKSRPPQGVTIRLEVPIT